MAAASNTARSLALLVVVACDRGGSQPPPAPKGTPLAAKEFFRIDVAAPPSCQAGQPSDARLVLTALGDYHINEQYPFKFVGDPADAFEGTFTRTNAKTGTLTIRFRPERPGPATVAGTFKLSVCTDENCEIAEPKITFDVTCT